MLAELFCVGLPNLRRGFVEGDAPEGVSLFPPIIVREFKYVCHGCEGGQNGYPLS